jgi:hypothetical protein
MLTDTQISSFLIPKNIWEDGVGAYADLPPLAIPARDALDIERRAKKGINLHNEERRYTLCCERIQGIAQELSQGTNTLPSPMVWPAHRLAHETTPSARAYLGLIEVICISLGKLAIDARLAAVFFVPEDIKLCLTAFEALRKNPGLNNLFERAARIASPPGSPFKIIGAQCSIAFTQRYEFLKHAGSEMCAIVDVVELV